MTATVRQADAEPPAPPVWIRALGALPWSVAYALAGAIAWFVRAVLRVRVRLARENLTGCFPDWPRAQVDATLRQHYRSFSEALVEFIKQAGISAAELRERMRCIDSEPVHASLAAGRPVMALTAHYGNWEWGLQRVQLEFGVPVVAAYKPPHSAAADRVMNSLRGRFGVRMVAAKRLLREVTRLRRVPHIAAFVADQVPTTSPNRHWLSFLGRATAFFPGPAEIARMGNYDVYYAAITRTARGHYEMRFVPVATADEALEPLDLTRRYAACVEAQVRAAPAGYMWGHRRWKLEPPAGDDDLE
jgi:KDO2-lipid IV(A) lauroyltransferase